MSPNSAPRQPPKKRRAIIKHNVAIKTLTEIADICGCEPRTIDRDIADMKRTGEWWQWLENEYLRLHRDPDISKETKLREIAKLYGKQFITSKEESRVEHAGKVDLDINALLKTYEELFKEDAVPEDDTGKPIHPSHTNGETG